MMVKRISELEHILADLIQVNKNIKERLNKHRARLYTLEQLDIPQHVSIPVSEVVTDTVDWAMQSPLRNRFRDLLEADMKEILHQCMWESDSYKYHEDHMQLFEALEKSMNRDHSEELAQDLAEARKKKKKSPGPSGASGAPRASGSAQMPPSPPPPSSTNQESPSKGSATPNLEMDEDMALDEQAQSSNDEYIGSAYILMVNLRQGWWKPFEEERPTTPEPAWSIRSSDVPTGDIATFIDWFCKRRGSTELKPQDLEGPAYEIVKVFHPDVSIAVSEVVTDTVDWAMQAPLRNRFRDLLEADMKEILHQRMWESDSYKYHKDHMQLFEALEKSMNRDHSEELAQDLAEAHKKKKKTGPSGASGAPRSSGSAQMPPSPPPPSSTNQESPSKGSATPSPSKTAASAKYQAWMTTDIRLRPSISLTPADLEMDEDMAPDEQAQSSNDEYIESAYIPTVNLRQGWWKSFEEERPTTPEPAWSIRSSDVPVLTNNWASALASNYSPPPEDSLLVQTGDITAFIDWFCKRRGITELKPQDLEGPAYEIVKVFHPDRIEDFQLGIESYQTQVNLTKPQWTTTGFEYKHDYTVIKSPRAVIFQDKYEVQMMMRFNEIHKFSDGTLLQIDEALDYRVKEFRINRLNPGLNTRFWTRKDVDRCNAFMFAIQRRLRTRRIFRNLESFVGGRVREGDSFEAYRLIKLFRHSRPLFDDL
nr:hypothetical protein [Tanacetum cinerariifolium]